ncbi:MAG: anion permease [Anaerolineales bacterium]|jgi:PiT family inorganic phosphate transporter
MNSSVLLVILTTLALIYSFLNGFHDSANVVATMISSRAMQPRGALIIAALGIFAGPFIFGVAVAATIGNGIAPAQALTIQVVLAGLLSAIIWNLITWWFGIPSSSSHALIGGLVGAVLIGAGPQTILVSGLIKVGFALFFSPIIGFLVGAVLMRLMLFIFKNASPRINTAFRLGQIPTTLALALSNGANDPQKTMGVITMGLVVLGFESNFVVPLWVVLASAAAMALGTALGGWRVIRTLGGKFYRIRPIHSITSQIGSAGVILSASLLGGPVSTTQVVSSSIIGVGAAQRVSQVRWGVTRDILAAWLLTIPVTAAMAALIYLAITSFFF